MKKFRDALSTSILSILFLLCTAATSQAQRSLLRIGVQSSYLPHFAVREAMDDNVRPIGIRAWISDYDRTRFEFGAHFFTGYGDVALASFGLDLTYLLAERNNHYFKGGLSMGKIDLDRFDANENEFGYHVGDASYADFSQELKPYLEWEWMFSRFSSLFVTAGYRIINGKRSVVTEVEGTGLDSRITGRDEKFFYAASGFDFGIGLSINLY